MNKIILSLIYIAIAFSPSLAVDENSENIESRDPKGVIKHLRRITQCARIIAGDTQDPEQYQRAETKCLKVSPDWNGPEDGEPYFTEQATKPTHSNKRKHYPGSYRTPDTFLG